MKRRPSPAVHAAVFGSITIGRPVAYMVSGERIVVLDEPSETPGCFCGWLLDDTGKPIELSGLWDKAQIRWQSTPGQWNIFRDSAGNLNRTFLRHSAVRRLFEHGRIDCQTATELLICKPALRARTVETWTDLAGEP